MSIQPLITFKAGQCDVDTDSQPWKIKPLPQAGYIYLYIGAEDEMVHFCWRPRSAPADEPVLDLIMIPGDGTFLPYTGKEASASSENVTSPAGGRIFVLKFSSSSQRHLFWMQSKTQHPDGKPNWFSQRDLRIGQIVDMLLQGAEVDVQAEMEEVRENGHPPRRDDEDEDMEDAPPANPRLRSNSTGGAGAGATGGDIRDEGEEAREGGADGGRAASATASAPTDASSIVQNFLNSLKAGGAGAGGGGREQNIFTTLSDLLNPETCIPVINAASSSLIDSLLAQLPPTILMQSQQPDSNLSTPTAEPSKDVVDAAIQEMNLDQKKELLERVIRSPQLHQSLGSLTAALRDGGLPMVAQALNLDVENGGLVKGGNVPLGGGDAVEAFTEAVRRTVKKEDEEGDKEKKEGEGGSMDTT